MWDILARIDSKEGTSDPGSQSLSLFPSWVFNIDATNIFKLLNKSPNVYFNVANGVERCPFILEKWERKRARKRYVKLSRR